MALLSDVPMPDTPNPINGLNQGLLTGLNAGKMIQDERRQQEAFELQKKAAATAQRVEKFKAASELLDKKWAPAAFKLQLYNQSVKPFFAESGLPAPDLDAWPDFGDKLAKEINDIVKNSEKANDGKGIAAEDLRMMISMKMAEYEPEFQTRVKPVLDAVSEGQKHTEKMAELAVRTNEAQTGRQQRFDDAQVVKFSKTIEDLGVPKAITQFQKINELLPPPGQDIPGFGVGDSLKPGLVAGEKARALRQAIQGLQNVTIKDTSGATVTAPEFARLKEEFGSGLLKTEAQIRQGLQTAMNSYKERLANAYRGYDPGVRTQYFSNANGIDYLDTFSKYNFDGSTAAPQAGAASQPGGSEGLSDDDIIAQIMGGK